MAYAFEVTGRRLADDVEVTFLFAMGRTMSFTDHARAKAGLRSFDIATQRIEIDRNGVVRAVEDSGEIVVANMPEDIGEAGPWDDLTTAYSFKGRSASIYWVPALVWADKTLVANPIIEQPVADTADGTVTFPVRDPRADLDTPLVTSTYAGDNVAPDGVEGEEDLKGKRRLVHFGPCSNFEADKVNAQKLIYQLSAAPGSVLCVRDGGVPLTASTIRGSLASLEANTPPEGGHDVYTGAEGLFVRLARLPQFRLTFDATTGSAEADRTHAQTWEAIRTGYCGTDSADIDDDSVYALDGARPREAGFLFRDETRREAIDRVLASISGFERRNLDGSWSIHWLKSPGVFADLSLVMVTPDAAMTADDRAIISPPARNWPSYAIDGAPPRKVNVRWGLNNTVMTPADFAGSAATRLRDKFKDAWRVESDEDPSVWDPVALTGDFPDAGELTIDTGYQPGDDGRTCPHAATEAERLLSRYSGLRGQFEVTYRPDPTDPIMLPGKVVQLTYPAHDLDTGPLFTVLQGRLRAEGRIAEASVLLGSPGPGITPEAALCFAVDLSGSMAGDRITTLKAALESVFERLSEAVEDGGVYDIGVVTFGLNGQSITRRAASVADIAAVDAWVQALLAGVFDTDFRVGMDLAKTFFDATDAGITDRRLYFITDGEPTSIGGDPAATIAADAAATLALMPDVLSYGINIDLTDTTYTAYVDNTPSDGVPVVTSSNPEALRDAIYLEASE